MDKHRVAGYRIIEFSHHSRESLRQIAQCLVPHEKDILDGWVMRQCEVWEPPGFSRDELTAVFARLLRSILSCLNSDNLDSGFDDLSEAGAELAARKFPFEALVVSVHFLEESYLPYVLDCMRGLVQERLIAMDEFLHAAIATIATSYFNSHRRELLEQVEVGRLIQEGLMAHIPRESCDLEIAHIYLSAHESARLGGDFLDHFTLENGCSAFLIGDLAGHGLDAAADSVTIRSLYRGFMRENADPANALGRLNDVLVAELKSGLFATALAIAYELNGEFSIVNAGHCYPIVCDGMSRLCEISGTVLALEKGTEYAASRFVLPPGGVLVAYTDGLIEARNSSREFFGEERVMQIISEMQGVSPRAIADTLVDHSLRHAGGKFVDDVAVLIIKRKKAEP